MKKIFLESPFLLKSGLFSTVHRFLPNLAQSNEVLGHGSNKLTDFEILALSQNKLDEYKDTFFPAKP